MKSFIALTFGLKIILCLCSTSSAEQIVFSEIQYNPKGEKPEYIEIQNLTATPKDISRWRMSKGVEFKFPDFNEAEPDRAFLKKWERILLSSVDEVTLRKAYSIPVSTKVYGPWEGSLNNGGELIVLEDKNGVIMAEVEYDDDGRKWPIAADGAGHTLRLVHENRGAKHWKNWGVSLAPDGTPGTGSAEDAGQTTKIIGLDSVWKYDQSGADNGTSWRDVEFNDSSWNEGPGIFGKEGLSNKMPDPGFQTPWTTGGKFAYYLRKDFNWSGAFRSARILMDGVFDDGIVVYLNGQEIGRKLMPAGSVNWQTPGQRGEAKYGSIIQGDITGLLKSGRNVLAVEIHNERSGSSDIVFGADVSIATIPPDLTELLTVSEVHFDDEGTVDWIELHVPGQQEVSLDEFALASLKDFSDAINLDGKIPSGGYVSFETDFKVENNSTFDVYLVTGTTVIDAHRFAGDSKEDTLQSVQVHSGHPQFRKEWYRGAGNTRNAANDPVRNADIVINEIMYDAPSDGRTAEFIELYNKGQSTVDLSGWRILDGVGFEFPSGTNIGPGGFLVVAADAEWMRDNYGDIPVVGNFSGQLRDSGELLRIEDLMGNLVDQVYYYPSGDWPEHADGDGSSMELRHPDMDNDSPVAWADSDESQKSKMQTFTYTDIFDRVTWSPLTSGQELHMHLVGDAHMLIKNVSMKLNGAGSNLVKNPSVMSPDSSSAKGWVCQGTHWGSFVENGVLNLVADGHGDNKANRAEVDLGNLSFDTDYTLTFDAKWVWGKSRLIVQTLDHGFGTSFHIPIPNNLGTPGKPNSQSIQTAAPTLVGAYHSPAVPEPSEPVKITVRVDSSLNLNTVRVFHRADNNKGDGSWSRATMYDNGSLGGDVVAGDGIFTATLNDYTKQGNIAQFYVEAKAVGGGVSMMPKLGPERPAMFIIDGREMKDNLLRERFIISDYDRRALSSGNSATYKYNFPRMSNHFFNATFIVNESEIFYNAEIRKSGSPYTRDGGSSLGHGKWKLPGDRLFRERRRSVFDASGTSEGSGTPRFYDDRIAREWIYQLGHPINEMEFVHWVVNGDSFKLRENHEPISSDFMNRNFENGSDGTLLRIDDEWRFTDDGGNSRQSRNADWSYKNSDNPVQYHSEWIMRSREQDYDYSNFIEFVRAIGTRKFDEETINRIADRDMLCINAAVRGYDADWDTITLNRGKNAYFYRPKGGKWMLIHWDGDRVFSNSGETIIGGLSGIRTYFDKPYIKRYLNYYLTELLTKLTKGSARTEAWMRFETEAVAGTGITMTSSHYKSWFNSRESRARSHIGSPYNTKFKILTRNTPTTRSAINLNGTSPSTVYEVRVVNQEHAISEWTSADDWNLDNVLLREGQNTIVVQGVNHEGVVVHTEEFKIVKNQDSPPVISIQSTPASRNIMTTDSIEFDLGESFDPEGTELIFDWSVSPEQGVALIGEDSKPVMSFAIPGQYSVNVRAADGDGSESVAVLEVLVYGYQGFSSFKSNYLDGFWETKNIEIEDNTPERSSYSLETVDGQLHIKIINDRDYPLGLPDVSLPPSKNYVSLGDAWKYNDKNLDFGVDFSRIDFDDASWLSAPGIFGVDTKTFPDPGLQTPLNRDSANNLLTYYFRKKFDFKDDPIGSLITLEAILDDGARFWINGQEIQRVRLPAAPAQVDWKTRASGNVSSRDEGKLLPVVTIDGSGVLVEGTNVLAVDLHNYSAGSSDIAMGATLDIAAQPSGAGGDGIESTIHPWIKRDIPDEEDWLLQTNLELYGLQFGDFVTGLMVEVEREDKSFRYAIGNKGGDQLSVVQVTPAATTGTLFSLPYTLTNDMTVRIKRQANDLVFEWRPQDQFEEVYRISLPKGSKIIEGGPFAATQSPLELNVLFDYVLLSLPDSASSSFDQLVVSEVMYKPDGGDQFEFIELFNAGTSPINLKGFRFPQGQPFDEFVFGDIEMQAGSYLLVVNDIESFQNRYGEGLSSIIAGEWGGGSLSNGGEVITLLDDRGLTVLSFEYDDSEPWPTSPDENGTSLTLSDPRSGGVANAENWSSSTTVGGSPGVAETVTAFSIWLEEREEVNPLAVKPDEVLNNVFTYAFGLDISNLRPEDAVPSPGLITLEGEDYLTIKYHKRISDPELKYDVELSNDGINWSSERLNLIALPPKMVADGVEVVIFRMENPLKLLDNVFLRLVVSFQ